METREKFINAALKLFADKGFYGASMDMIAGQVGLTKQALIHHFRTKEKLYAAVLQVISDRLLALLHDPVVSDSSRNEDRFTAALENIYEHMLAHPDDAQLLMRELLDNQRRADSVETWYLRPFFDELREWLTQIPGWADADPTRRATHAYQLVGAMHYFVISTTTLAHMYSPGMVEEMKRHFVEQFRTLACAAPSGSGISQQQERPVVPGVGNEN